MAEPVRVAIVGLTHDHVFWLLNRPTDRGDIEIVGVCEPNIDLAKRRMSDAGLDGSLHYTDLGKLLAEAKPEAACLFGSIREHREQAIACAAAGAHVMVEKPLALTLSGAQAMANAAEKGEVHLLTNYETTWQPAVHELRRRVASGELGALRRMNFRMGHFGPVEIGCRPEFLDWLLDPKENGGGAITDFGCYGVNIATWLRRGERPLSVSATTKQIKRDVYAAVDDDATIVLEYPDAIAVVEASWNWPDHVKWTRVTTERAELETIGANQLAVNPRDEKKTTTDASTLAPAEADPFAHLAAVVRGEAKPNALSSVENNLVVMEVLDAARRSAQSGRRVRLAR